IPTATTLSKATVAAAIEGLELAGIIRTAGQQHGRRGRSPVAYEIRGNAGFVLGIDIGGFRHANQSKDTNVGVAAAAVFAAGIDDEQLPTSHDGARAVSAQVLEI